ncbi:hypothetical protein Syn6312_3234 [Synechococcus sp. PCC 6312]|nr:hypothetical protein Syn6312_3234 [Synechococcus sp. PCC 6312]
MLNSSHIESVLTALSDGKTMKNKALGDIMNFFLVSVAKLKQFVKTRKRD